MLQGATIAERKGDPEQIVAAALLHDIGHIVGGSGSFSMDDTEDRFHERAGARLLEPFFPRVVVDCCRFHVAAKRYLCASDPGYFDTLSAASVHSLTLQGGHMNAEEAAQFETQPNLHEIIAVRYLDDAGKRVGMATRSLPTSSPCSSAWSTRDPGTARLNKTGSFMRIAHNAKPNRNLRNRVVLRSHKIVDNPWLS